MYGVGNERIRMIGNRFSVTDNKGNILISADRSEVTIGSQKLHVNSK